MGYLSDMTESWTEAAIGNELLQMIAKIKAEYPNNQDVATALERIETRARSLSGSAKWVDALMSDNKN